MAHTILDLGVAKLIGSYSDAIVTPAGQRWLFSSGTPGLEQNGNLPASIEAQSEIAWQHLLNMLEQAHMTTADLVKVSTSLLHAEHIAPYAAVRKRFLGDIRPAFMLTVVPQLVRPDFLVEIEIIAARAD